MKFSFAGVFADAGLILRSERELLLRLAGVFYVLPLLGIVLLLAASHFPPDVPPEQARDAVMAFYSANLLPILIAQLTIDFGTFAVLNLYLQGNGRTLGEVLKLSVMRLLPYVAIDLLCGFAFTIGTSLLIVPGLFLFARTWLAAPAYAARPEDGVIEAFRQGWVRSRGFAWLTMLAAVIALMLGALGAVVAVNALIGVLSALTGGSEVVAMLAYLVTAIIGGLAWTGMTVLRVAAYRGT